MQTPGPKIKILDHGYLQLVDVMGGDADIVDAARVSIAGERTTTVSSDFALIRYLMRHRHTTPFEMVEFKFRAKMPILVARQWVRHRTANINEMSARYSMLPAEWYVPTPERIRSQSTNNKQGSSDLQLADAEKHAFDFANEAAEAYNAYEQRINSGMAKELARTNLPLSMYTEWIWKMDLHNLFHFLGLRNHGHAQEEIRVYAEPMMEMVRAFCPMAVEAFEDFRLNAISLSAQEIQMLGSILHTLLCEAERSHSDVLIKPEVFKTEREHTEFVEKFNKILA